ncbi:MAG: glycosyltransferase [Bacteroidetes bacterium]|nr:MAG: glycosyltransferase [Bacteroidota bacterium]
MNRIILSVTNDLVTDQRVNKVALTLAKIGYDVTIVGRKLKNSLDINNRSYKTKRFKLLFNKKWMFYAEYNLRLFFYLLFKKFDILVSNDLDSLLSNYCISVIRNKKLVYDSHEYFTEVPELINRNFQKKIWLSIERFILPKIKYSYTVCKSIANDYYKKYGVKMEVIRNVPLRKTATNSSEKISTLKKELCIEDKKIIIYQGSLNIGRGIEQVINAMKFIDNTIFLIIGDGDIAKKLVHLTKQKGLEKKIIFLGKIPFDKLNDYTGLADIGISLEQNLGLNYYYSLPNKIFDYINAGVPILASDLPEIANIVKKYEIGEIIKDFSPDIIADAINSMLNDEHKISEWEKKLKYAAEELCWEKEEIKLIDFYNKIKIN